MPDYDGLITTTAKDDDVVRVYPSALVQIYTSGTATLVAEVTADENGHFTVATLATGKYDIKVDGKLRGVLQHVKADHTHPAKQTWTWFLSGAINSDSGEVNTRAVFGAAVAGQITEIGICLENVGATGDCTVHLLKGQSGQATALSVASDSAWSYRIFPQSAQKRFLYIASPLTIPLIPNDCVTLGIDYTAGTIEGLSVWMTFSPNA